MPDETTAPDVRAAFEKVEQLVRWLSPTAENIRVVYDTPGAPRSVLAIPAHDAETVAEEPSNLTVMQQAVTQTVDEMRRGDVLSFEEIGVKAGYANTEGL